MRVASKWVLASTQVILHQSFIHFTQRGPPLKPSKISQTHPIFDHFFKTFRHFYFEQSLAYTSRHERPTSPFDSNGVYVGEFGIPESEATPAVAFERTTELLNVARKFGCPYAVYWQIYCNERTTASPKSENGYKWFLACAS